MGPCSPLVSEGKNGDLLTWQPEASMPPLHVAERVRVRERRRGRKEKGKVEIRKKDKRDGEGESRRRRMRRKQTLASLGEQMEPREGREEEERGSEGGRRGEAHNAMGHGSWTDSICSQLSVAPVMDGELVRHGESGKGGRRGDNGRKSWE